MKKIRENFYKLINSVGEFILNTLDKMLTIIKDRTTLIIMVLIVILIISIILFFGDYVNIRRNDYFVFQNTDNPHVGQEEIHAIVKNIDPDSSEAVLDIFLIKPKRYLYDNDITMKLSNPKELDYGNSQNPVRAVASGVMQVYEYDEDREIYEYLVQDLRIIIETNKLPFPFDSYRFNVTFDPYYFFKESYGDENSDVNAHIAAETVTVLMDDQDFVYSTNQTSLELRKNPGAITVMPGLPDTTVDIKVSRPLSVRFQSLAILVLLLAIACWSFFKLSGFKGVADNAFEILLLNLGILLAIPGIKDSIVPANMDRVPFIDLIINTIILLLVTSMVMYLRQSDRKK